MWWTTDSRVLRQPRRLDKSTPPRGSVTLRSTITARKRRHRKLPISVAQAAANLILQESGADSHVEVFRLKKDIRSLESALQNVTHQSKIATSSIEALQKEKQQQRGNFDQLVDQFEVLQTEHEHLQLRTCGERAWLKLAVDLASTLGRRSAARKLEVDQQLSELRDQLDQVRSDNQELTNRLKLTSQENKIFSDVISDMESRHEREGHQAQELSRVLQKRLSQQGASDRSQVQQLNIRIVSQAAEIRSLKKQLAGMQHITCSNETGYEIILDDQPTTANRSDMELKERLENSLQAARIELDSAVHELKYAQAESNRLRQYAKQVEEKYDSEFHSVVQVAELHATLAGKLQQTQESAEPTTSFDPESLHQVQAFPVQATVDELVARNNERTHALKVADALQATSALRSEKIDMQAQEVHELHHELETLRELQAALSGDNKTLLAVNEDLEQRLSWVTQQLSTMEQKRSEDKTEWEKLLAHHEGGTRVAEAECRFVQSQLEDLRVEFESKLKQQLEVIQCLNADVGAARALQSQLERKLEGETLNRQLAELEVRQMKQDTARLSELVSVGNEKSTKHGEEPGEDGVIRSAA